MTTESPWTLDFSFGIEVTRDLDDLITDILEPAPALQELWEAWHELNREEYRYQHVSFEVAAFLRQLDLVEDPEYTSLDGDKFNSGYTYNFDNLIFPDLTYYFFKWASPPDEDGYVEEDDYVAIHTGGDPEFYSYKHGAYYADLLSGATSATIWCEGHTIYTYQCTACGGSIETMEGVPSDQQHFCPSMDGEMELIATRIESHNWYSDDSYHWYEDGSSVGTQLEKYETMEILNPHLPIDEQDDELPAEWEHGKLCWYQDDDGVGVGLCPHDGSRLQVGP